MLDKNKTYIFGTIGTGPINDFIQINSPSKKIPFRQRWTHVLLVFFDTEFDMWVAGESHADVGGVRMYDLFDWINNNITKTLIEGFPFSVDPNLFYSFVGCKYGWPDLVHMKADRSFIARFLKRDFIEKDTDLNTQYCSQLVLNCSPKLQEVIKFKPWQSVPLDLQQVAHDYHSDEIFNVKQLLKKRELLIPKSGLN